MEKLYGEFKRCIIIVINDHSKWLDDIPTSGSTSQITVDKLRQFLLLKVYLNFVSQIIPLLL